MSIFSAKKKSNLYFYRYNVQRNIYNKSIFNNVSIEPHPLRICARMDARRILTLPPPLKGIFIIVAFCDYLDAFFSRTTIFPFPFEFALCVHYVSGKQYGAGECAGL